MKTYKIGIIGCGAVTEIFHLPILKRTAIFQVSKIADIDKEQMKKLKSSSNMEFEMTTDYYEILEDELIDAVLIATPPHLHAKVIKDAFNADKDVLCEKPLTSKLGEAKDIVRSMEENKKILVVGYNFRFIPQYKKLKEVTDKKLGEIIGVQSTFCANAYVWPSKTKFQQDLSKGGGVLAEMGTHHIDLVSWILKRPKKVWCHLGLMDKDSPVYDRGNLFIEYEDNKTASINLGWRNFTVNYVNVFGTEGYAYADHQNARVLVYPIDLIAQPPIILKSTITGSPFQEEWLYFANAMKTRKNPLFSSLDLLSPVAIVDRAYESMENKGKMIPIGDLNV